MLVEVGIDEEMRNHLHLVLQIPPRYSRSDVIAQIKAGSTSQLRKKFAWLKQVNWKENIVWSPGFFLSTVGVDKKVIENYVKWQGKKDLGQLQMKL